MSVALAVIGGAALVAGFVATGTSGIAHAGGDASSSSIFGRVGLALIIAGALCWRFA